MKYSTTLNPGYLTPIPEMNEPDVMEEISYAEYLEVYKKYKELIASLPSKIKAEGDWSNMPEVVDEKDFEVRYEIITFVFGKNEFYPCPKQYYNNHTERERRIVAYPLKKEGVVNSDKGLMPDHKCIPIARAQMSEGRDWWLGKLTEQVKDFPAEKFCLHIKTPLKDIVLLCNDGDFQQLSVLCRHALGYVIDEDWLQSQIEDTKIVPPQPEKEHSYNPHSNGQMGEDGKITWAHPPRTNIETIKKSDPEKEQEKQNKSDMQNEHKDVLSKEDMKAIGFGKFLNDNCINVGHGHWLCYKKFYNNEDVYRYYITL